MASHWITECPHCDTSFRVTEQHLRAAKGSVRCGSCLQIFNAIDTLFPNEKTDTTPDVATPARSPIVPPPDTPEPTPFLQDEPEAVVPNALALHDDFIDEPSVSENTFHEPPVTDPRQEREAEQAQLTVDPALDEHIANGLASPVAPPETHYEGGDYLANFDAPDITTPELDDPWVDAPYLDASFLDAAAATPWHYENEIDYLISDSFSKTEADESAHEEDESLSEEVSDEEKIDSKKNDPAFFDETIAQIDDANTDDEIESLYDEPLSTVESDETPESDIAINNESAGSESETTTSPLLDDDILLVSKSRIPSRHELFSENVWQSEDNEQEQGWQTLHEEQEPHIGPYREPFRDTLLQELEAEPPRGFQWHDADTPLRTKIMWWGFNVILVLVLCIQHVLFHYQDFAGTLQKPPFKGLVNGLCNSAGCGFIRTNLSFVRSENLVVRAHPTQAGFLMLDTILLNYATFEQPFPLLDLSFSDIKDKTIARRVFKPAEYLTGDLTNLTTMPVNTPLHINLAIKNPSEIATNYKLKLLINSR